MFISWYIVSVTKVDSRSVEWKTKPRKKKIIINIEKKKRTSSIFVRMCMFYSQRAKLISFLLNFPIILCRLNQFTQYNSPMLFFTPGRWRIATGDTSTHKKDIVSRVIDHETIDTSFAYINPVTRDLQNGAFTRIQRIRKAEYRKVTWIVSDDTKEQHPCTISIKGSLVKDYNDEFIQNKVCYVTTISIRVLMQSMVKMFFYINSMRLKVFPPKVKARNVYAKICLKNSKSEILKSITSPITK